MTSHLTTEEVQRIAADLRALHKVNGAVVITLEAEQTLFGFAFLEIDKAILMREMPRVLREMASKIEAGLTMTPHETTRLA